MFSGGRVQCGHLYVCAGTRGMAVRTDVFETDFSTPIFEEYLGLGRKLSLILGSVLATVYALSACISFPLVDKAGRRKLFFIGTWGQALSMFLIMVRPLGSLCISAGLRTDLSPTRRHASLCVVLRKALPDAR